MKYEYKSEYKDNCFEDSVTETSWLNEMGNEGWELVRASQRTSSSRIYYFKRAIPSPDDKDKEIARLKGLLEKMHKAHTFQVCFFADEDELKKIQDKKWSEFKTEHNL